MMKAGPDSKAVLTVETKGGLGGPSNQSGRTRLLRRSESESAAELVTVESFKSYALRRVMLRERYCFVLR